MVPHFHRRWPLWTDRTFVDELRALVDAGAEILLHGESHLMEGPPLDWAGRLKARWMTAGEGEFLALDEQAAYERAVRGRDLLESLGLDPIGFVAPAWLFNRSADRAVARAGFRFHEDHAGLRLVHPERPAGRIDAPVLTIATRTPLRLLSSLAYAEVFVRRILPRAPLARIALHPLDFENPAACAAWDRILRTVGETATITTYAREVL